MTIEEYKGEFLKLLKQLEAEHGRVQLVEIEKEEISPIATMTVIKITF